VEPEASKPLGMLSSHPTALCLWYFTLNAHLGVSLQTKNLSPKCFWIMSVYFPTVFYIYP
jgi:hypothetical protein